MSTSNPSSSSSLPYTIMKLTSASILSSAHSSPLFPHRSSLDSLGVASGISQKLKGPLTTFENLQSEKAIAEKQVVYLVFTAPSSSSSSSSASLPGVVLFGYLKLGTKSLYLTPSLRSPLRSVSDVQCVLDFYVDTSLQRSGVGRALFGTMLKDVFLLPDDDDVVVVAAAAGEGNENKERGGPERLAYDRPSDMMLPFLRRHFGMEDGFWNSNNYVTFGEGFWVGRETPDAGKKNRR